MTVNETPLDRAADGLIVLIAVIVIGSIAFGFPDGPLSPGFAGRIGTMVIYVGLFAIAWALGITAVVIVARWVSEFAAWAWRSQRDR